MRPAELEERVLKIIDAVKAGQSVEDATVELKAEWPEPWPAAWRIGGMCNAARGEPALLIVGLDEKRVVVGAKGEDLADWLQRVQSCFDQVFPTALLDRVVHDGDSTVVAILFDSSHAPFVLKGRAVPKLDAPSTETEDRAVPWREGTRVRRARRDDLIRMLVPAVRNPDIDVLGATVVCMLSKPPEWTFQLILNVLAIARGNAAFIAHRCSVVVEPQQFEPKFDDASMWLTDPRESNPTYEAAIVANGPTELNLIARWTMSGIGPVLPPELSCDVELHVIDVVRMPRVRLRLRQVRHSADSVEFATVSHEIC